MFLALNYWGVELSFTVSVIVTLRRARRCWPCYWVSAMPHFDFTRWALNIGVGPDGTPVELPEGGGPWLPFGLGGVLATLPFAVWLFLAIEQLPLAAEESVDPKKDMPKGLIYGMSTLMVSALLIMFLNSGDRLDRRGQDAWRVLAGDFRRAAARWLPRHLRRRRRRSCSRCSR